MTISMLLFVPTMYNIKKILKIPLVVFKKADLIVMVYNNCGRTKELENKYGNKRSVII